MAGTNSDGSIIIDTGLDTKGFDKGSKELLAAIQSLTQEVNQLGQTLQNTFSNYGNAASGSNTEVDALQNKVVALEAKVESLNATIADLQAKLAEAGGEQIVDPDALTQAGSAAGSAETQIEALEARIQELEGVVAELQSRLGEVDAQAVAPSFNMDQPKQSVTTLEKDIGKLGTTIEGMGKIADAAIEGDVKALNKFDEKSEQAQSTIDGLRQRLEAFGNTKFPTEDYKWMTSEITKADKTLQRLLDRQDRMDATGVKKNSKQYKNLQYDIEQARMNLSGLKAELADMEAEGEAFTMGSDTSQFAQYTAALDEIEGRLSGMQQEVQAAFVPPHLEQWNQMITLSGMIRSSFINAFSTIRNAALSIGNAVTHPIQSLDRLLGAVVTRAKNAASALAGMAKDAIVSGIRRIGEAAKNAAKHLATMTKNAVGNRLKSLGSSLFGVGKGAGSANKGLNMGLKTMLKYGLGIRSTFVLVNKLRNALVDGFGKMAQHSASFNSTISQFMTALNQLKYSFAAAFAPIAQVVLPLLTAMANAISAVVTRIGMLIAALTGKSTFAKAKAVQTDYAASLDGTSKSASGASDAIDDTTDSAKEAQKTIAGFDDVEILSDNSDTNKNAGSGGSGGSGGGAEDYFEDYFEDVPIDSMFGDLAQMIKDAWAKADFTEIGRMVGEKLKAALESIPWSKIKATLRKIAKCIATFLNGFLETPGLFTVIGKTIAEAINSAFEFVDSFVSNFHWNSLGIAIRDLILGVLNNIDWPLIYRTMTGLGAGIGTALENALNNQEVWSAASTALMNALNSLVYGAVAFLEAVNWKSAGQNIGQGLNDGIEAFDWNAVSTLLIDLINGVFDLWYNFVTTFDFKKFGSRIGTSMSDAIKGINWAEGGAGVGETINALYETLNGFVTSTDWKALGSAVIQSIAGFFGSLDWGLFAETLSSCIKGLFDALTGAIQEVDWKALPGHIVDAIGTFLTEFDWAGVAESVGALIGAAFTAIIEVGSTLWETLKGVGKNIMEGGFQGILDALANVGTWIVDNIFTPFINGFKSAFGIESPSKEMKPLGGYIIEGMLNGIIEGLASIGTWIVDNVFTPVITGFRSAFGLDGDEPALLTIGKSLIGGLKDGLLAAMDGVGDWIDTNITGPILGFFKDLFGINSPSTVFAEYGGYLLAGLKNGLLNAMNGIGDWIGTNVTGPICGFFKNLFGINSPSTVFAGYGGYLMEGLKEGIEEEADTPKTALSTAQEGMKGIFSATQKLTAWAKVGSNVMTLGLKAGIVGQTPAVLKLVQKLEESMRKEISSKESTWKSTMTKIMTSLQSVIKGKTSAIKSAMTNLMTQLHSAIQSRSSSLTNTMSSIANNMANSFSRHSWYSIGSNIGMGIYNGLIAYSGYLQTLAWNTAVNMYNAACRALNIHSPSRKFAWIGEMITAGLGNGIEDTQSNATDAVTSLADAVTKEAESASPLMQIDTALSGMADGLDEILASFSDKVIEGFDSLISALENVANGANFTVPAVANGSVAPYATRTATEANTGYDLSDLIETLTERDEERVTRDDLREILTNVVRQYMNIDFYIGDEQVARHANAGNKKLNRRYSTTG